MRKIIIVLATLALVILGAGPAEAAKHKKNHKHTHPCSSGPGVTHTHKHKKAHHKKEVCKRPARVATRGEYNRLEYNMTLGEVASLFNAPRKRTAHYDQAIAIDCPPDTEFFCMDENGNGTGTLVAVGGRDDYEWFTGRDKYDGRYCYSINTEFYQDATGTYRLQNYQNWSNVCTTKYN